jgi:phenylpropionate dioxygenase-like ring-hydroxylating dioxygenase large terminal subunit
MAKSPFLKNTWYAALLSSDLSEDLFSRRILDIPILFYRNQDGAPIAMHDRCPHRFAPLSMGKKQDNCVVCPYHGLKFDESGKCVENPHGSGQISEKAKVRSFPLIERHGFIWIWMGDLPADESALNRHDQLDKGHPNGIAHTYMHRQCNYELITDNVMDLSHVDHLHGEIISTRGQLSPLIPNLVEKNGDISVRWEYEQTPAILILDPFLPKPGIGGKHFIEVTWSKPSHIQLTIGATQDENPILDYDHTVAQYDLHTCTPETENSTHYFFATRRNHLEEDADYNAMKIKAMHDAFEQEDGPILDAIQGLMETNDFLAMDPALISSDMGPIKVRRTLKKLIEAEQ